MPGKRIFIIACILALFVGMSMGYAEVPCPGCQNRCANYGLSDTECIACNMQCNTCNNCVDYNASDELCCYLCTNTSCGSGCPGTCAGTFWAVTNSSGVQVQYSYAWNASCACTQGGATGTYRCAAGYYGTATSSTAGCTRCPSMVDIDGTIIYGTSTAGNNQVVSSCVMSNTYTFPNNGVGNYHFRTNCNAQ